MTQYRYFTFEKKKLLFFIINPTVLSDIFYISFEETKKVTHGGEPLVGS